MKLRALLILFCCVEVTTITLLGNKATEKQLEEDSERFQKERDRPKCGHESCDLGQPGMLNVHLVPHTHDDVGWLKTVDQYYYGSKKQIRNGGVQYILDTVVTELQKDSRRRFIYVEIAFFSRWWNELHDSMRHVVKDLVLQGRLEFILGGWCMNDEASTHYNAIIDQHTLGFQFLRDNFGECGQPKIGWQIDPFGHSREQASLFAQFGFDGLFFGRLDYQDKDKRLKDKTMELMWEASSSLGDQAALMTGVTFNKYQAPKGFCFDSREKCTDDPIMDDEHLEDYNVPERVKAFIEAAQNQSRYFTTNHIMMTMGADFQYVNARQNFKNMDKLIHYVNQMQANGSKVNAFYSTPSCYLYALNQANQSYTTKNDDFFPYASRDHTFWTGYFTSRPALKRYVRETNNFLQVCKQLNVLSQRNPLVPHDIRINLLREAMGVAQHHDAVSGTEKQHVADDYAKRLAQGRAACGGVVQDAFSRLLSNTSDGPLQEFCPFLNVSHCPISETNSQFTVTLYNPTGRAVNEWTRIPVSGDSYSVTGPDSKVIAHQLVPISNATKALPEFKGSRASSELVFQAPLPSLGFSTFFIQAASENNAASSHLLTKSTKHVTSDIVIQNEFVSLSFSGDTGLLTKMTNLEKSFTVSLSQSLLFYKSFKGNNREGIQQSSGAYVFRPEGGPPLPISSRVKVIHNQGELVDEVVQVFSDWASQVVRLYKGERIVEIEWTVGPIPSKGMIGREIISRFSSNITNNGTFYTDSNGREVLKRIRDYRPTWKLKQTEKVAGSYYPVNSRIFIKNEMDSGPQVQLTVLTDRSQGGASIHDGEIELMVHRRMFHDDSFGVGEALNEKGISGKGLVVRGKHYLLLSMVNEAARQHRDTAQRLFMAPLATLAPNSLSPQSYRAKYKTTWSGLKNPLPANIHLLTLERWEGAMVLLRLEHFYEKDDDPELSKPVKIDLLQIFSTFHIAFADELILGANNLLKFSKRLEWNVEGHGRTNGDMSSYYTPVTSGPGQLLIILKPMQIRTFQLTLN